MSVLLLALFLIAAGLTYIVGQEILDWWDRRRKPSSTSVDWTPDPSRTVYLDEDDGRPLEPGWTVVTPTQTRSLRRIR